MELVERVTADEARDEASNERAGDAEPSGHQESHLLAAGQDRAGEKTDDETEDNEQQNAHGESSLKGCLVV
jgi:hypothetical protein